MVEETNPPATELLDHCCKTMKENEEFLHRNGFIPKVNVNQDTILRIISGGDKLFLVEEHIH